MKKLQIIASGIGLVMLSACGGGASETNAAENMDANMMMTDNAMMDMNATMDANMDMNAADGMNATENSMANDMNTNSPDTNLANGM
jgi:hypothetical protein